MISWLFKFRGCEDCEAVDVLMSGSESELDDNKGQDADEVNIELDETNTELNR